MQIEVPDNFDDFLQGKKSIKFNKPGGDYDPEEKKINVKITAGNTIEEKKAQYFE